MAGRKVAALPRLSVRPLLDRRPFLYRCPVLVIRCESLHPAGFQNAATNNGCTTELAKLMGWAKLEENEGLANSRTAASAEFCTTRLMSHVAIRGPCRLPLLRHFHLIWVPIKRRFGKRVYVTEASPSNALSC